MSKKLPVVDAKAKALDLVAKGHTVEQVMGAVGRTPRTWESWRATDKEFASRVDMIRTQRLSAKERGVDESVRSLTFPQWRKRFLGLDTYPHQQQWIDVLEGRTPSPIEGTEWDERNPNRILINTPPYHAKSQTITIDWVTYRICMDPNVRILLVSQGTDLARDMLHSIRQRLTSPQFSELQEAYAPKGGFQPKKGAGRFTQDLLYVAGRTSDHKDPTIQILGLRGKIYGRRADLIILDDPIDNTNAHEHAKQIKWLESEVRSRVKNGKIILVGTRLASQDLFSELREDSRYHSGKSPWSYLRQPMVLRYADKPEDWVTLWPYSTTPMDEELNEQNGDGLFIAWDGPAAAKIRSESTPHTWSLVYQQQQVSDDATFKPVCVHGSTDRRRKPGPLTAGAWGHPPRGKQGMWTIGSMDPGMGITFALVGSVDRVDNKRWIENAWELVNPTPTQIVDLIKNTTLEYGVNEWVIEEQGFQGFLIHDAALNAWLANRGVKVTAHYTGKNKLDPDFGVASMSPLFGTTRRINDGAGREVHNDGSNLIVLPDPDKSGGIRALQDELIAWVPGKRGKQLRQDGPMALWFFETRARALLGVDRPQRQEQFVNLPFMSRGAQKQRVKAPFAFTARRRIAG